MVTQRIIACGHTDIVPGTTATKSITVRYNIFLINFQRPFCTNTLNRPIQLSLSRKKIQEICFVARMVVVMCAVAVAILLNLVLIMPSEVMVKLGLYIRCEGSAY